MYSHPSEHFGHFPTWFPMAVSDEGLRSLRLPALPSVYYASEWQGYEELQTMKQCENDAT